MRLLSSACSFDQPRPNSFLFVAGSVPAMAWNGAGRRGKGGKGGKGSSEKKHTEKEAPKEAKYLKPVEARWHITKSALRPFASATGSPFYAGKGQTGSDFLSLRNLLEKLEPFNTETLNRLGVAVSEAGSTVSMGSELLDKYAVEPAEAGAKLGIKGVAELLQSDAGKDFVQAAAIFNKNDETSDKSAAALQTAAARWTGFFLEDPKAKAKAVQRLVKSSAALYLFGMELLQWLAAAQHPQKWAQKMKEKKALQNEKTQKWLRAPSDKDRLAAAIVASWQEQIEPPQKKRQALSDSEGPSPPSVVEEEAAKSSGEEQDNSSSEAKKKKAKKVKKDKTKQSKKSKKSSSSGSASPSTMRRRKAEPAE